MSKRLLIAVAGLALVAAFFIPPIRAEALSVYATVQGGTGTSSPSGILYGDNGATNHVNTVSIGTGLSFTGGTLSATNAGTVTSVTGVYPVLSSGGATPAISLAFGTTTSNLWAGTQTFTNAPIFSSLTGILKGNGSSALTVAANGTDYTLITANTCAGTNKFSAITAAGVLTCTADNTASSTLLGDNNIFSGTDTFNNTITGSVSGNAGTATKLQTSRTINNVGFDGTANIVITAASSSILGDNNTFSGTDKFSNPITDGALSGVIGGFNGLTYAIATSTLTPSAPLTGSFTQMTPNGSLGCTTAASGVAGCLNSTDWATFNNKISSTSLSATAPLNYTAATGAFTITSASAGVTGALTGTDWSTFNNKVSSTSLSGASVISYTPSSGVITTTGGTFGAGNYVFPSSLTIGSLTGPLQAVAGLVSASSSLSVGYGGTGSTTSLGGILAGNGLNGIKSVVIGTNLTFDGTTLNATGGGTGSAYPFYTLTNFGTTTSATGTPMTLAEGAFASSTIVSASSTAPQNILLDATGDDVGWYDRIIANTYYEGTTTGTTLATSSAPWLKVSPTGATIAGTVNIGNLALTTNLSTVFGGTGLSGFTANQIFYSNSIGTAFVQTATTTLGGGTTGLTFSNTPFVIGGSASALGGTLVVANGGTGLTSLPANQLLYGGAAGAGVAGVATSSETCSSPISCTTHIVVGSGGGAISLGTVLLANGGTGTTTMYNGGITFWNTTLASLSQAASTSSLFYKVDAGLLGLGTTSPHAQLDIASSTGPQILLHDLTSANPAWYLRATAATLYIGTSSVAGATSTVASIALSSSAATHVGVATTTWAAFGATGAVAFDGLASSGAGSALCLSTSFQVTAGTLGTCTPSSRRYKQDIEPITTDIALSEIEKLTPVTFHYKPGVSADEDAHHQERLGLIAEDVYLVDPRLVGLNASNTPETLEYDQFPALFVKALQEVIKKDTTQDARLDALEARVSSLESENKGLKAGMCYEH